MCAQIASAVACARLCGAVRLLRRRKRDLYLINRYSIAVLQRSTRNQHCTSMAKCMHSSS